MKPSDEGTDLTEEDLANANALVDEALASADALLTTAEREALRADLMNHMMGTPDGRQTLARLRKTHVPERSGEAVRGGATDAATSKKRGTGT